MYHPHLFARRAELLALRDLAETLPIGSTLCPIVEPVKADEKDLRRAIQLLGEKKIKTAVILNPVAGDFKKGGAYTPGWRKTLTEDFDNYPSLLPALVCRPTITFDNVSNFLSAYKGKTVAVLYWSPKLSDKEIQLLAKNDQIDYHINLHDQMSRLRRDLLPKEKAVDVRDHFTRCERNADYGGPEFFSDDHLTYSKNAVGFGDYSIVGSQFIAGGGQAHAVAIHAIYKSEGKALWIEHFISDDVDIEVGTVEGKYLQAATKLVAAAKARPTEFGKDAALSGFAEDVASHNFPGLAVSKRRQIYHHLALMHAMLV